MNGVRNGFITEKTTFVADGSFTHDVETSFELLTVMSGKKKGNVDTDIVFLIMQKLYKKENFDNVILVSGDGDYKRLVSFLIDECRFGKLLAPNRKQLSSLFKKIDSSYVDALDADDKRVLLEYKF